MITYLIGPNDSIKLKLLSSILTTNPDKDSKENVIAKDTFCKQDIFQSPGVYIFDISKKDKEYCHLLLVSYQLENSNENDDSNLFTLSCLTSSITVYCNNDSLNSKELLYKSLDKSEENIELTNPNKAKLLYICEIVDNERNIDEIKNKIKATTSDRFFEAINFTDYEKDDLITLIKNKNNITRNNEPKLINNEFINGYFFKSILLKAIFILYKKNYDSKSKEKIDVLKLYNETRNAIVYDMLLNWDALKKKKQTETKEIISFYEKAIWNEKIIFRNPESNIYNILFQNKINNTLFKENDPKQIFLALIERFNNNEAKFITEDNQKDLENRINMIFCINQVLKIFLPLDVCPQFELFIEQVSTSLMKQLSNSQDKTIQRNTTIVDLETTNKEYKEKMNEMNTKIVDLETTIKEYREKMNKMTSNYNTLEALNLKLQSANNQTLNKNILLNIQLVEFKTEVQTIVRIFQNVLLNQTPKVVINDMNQLIIDDNNNESFRTRLIQIFTSTGNIKYCPPNN